MNGVIRLEDSGKRTINGSVEFNRVNNGSPFNINASNVAFRQGLSTDDSPQAGDVTTSAGFTSPEIGTASTEAPKLSITGSVDTTDGNIGHLILIAQLARTRGLIKIYSNDSYSLPNLLSYSPDNSDSFTAESNVGSGNPMYARVGSVSIRQSASSAQRILYTLELLIHAE